MNKDISYKKLENSEPQESEETVLVVEDSNVIAPLDDSDIPSKNLDDSSALSDSEQPATIQVLTSDSVEGSTSAAANSSGVIPNTNDGVFSNMSAKPTLESYLDIVEKAPDEPLPSYLDIYGPSSNSAPSYFEPAVISVGSSDEILVEGLPVGSFTSFFLNFIVSYAFQIVGFMMTFLLHTSHASKNGSVGGFGATLIGFGFYVQSSITENSTTSPPQAPQPTPSSQNTTLDFDSPGNNIYISFFLMVAGWCLIIKSITNYFQAKRMEQIILSNPYQT
ncbi:hypothetical protein BB560_001718 [Smittium megazygosporum]|uniref:Metal homeostatis protein BSD2 n=1 Tax=Smittium megazygosporum TaxID=133381 RepID=A0A2T9ZGS3_9FUNG|nr:hypothetical protein BB560_001718 [Smittium megazygosporum]